MTWLCPKCLTTLASFYDSCSCERQPTITREQIEALLCEGRRDARELRKRLDKMRPTAKTLSLILD